jgi:RNA polymerase sigma-70 factor (ECF subfamily)
MMEEARLTELLVRYRDERDPEAIAQLFDETAARLFGLAQHLMRNRADAEDLVQETFLAAIESVGRFDAQQPVTGWLTGILTNKARYRRRQLARSPEKDRLDSAPPAQPHETAQRSEARTALREACARLPEVYRRVIDLVITDDLGPTEIAARLERKPGAVRTQLYRGVALLRAALPAGFALPVALLVFESPGLGIVRARILEHARGAAARAGTVGAGLAVKIGAMAVLSAGVVASVALMRGGDGDPLVHVSDERPGASAGEVVAPPSSPGSSDGLADLSQGAGDGTGRQAVVAAVVEDAEAPSPELTTIHFELRANEGYSFATRGIVDPEKADLVLDRRARSVQSTRPGSIAPLAIASSDVARDGRSNDCFLRAVVAVRPDTLEWGDGARASDKLFLLRTQDSGWALVSIVNQRRARADGVDMADLRAVFNPDQPVFRRDVESVRSEGALDVDPRAFDHDPFQERLDAARAELRAILEQRIVEAEATTSGGGVGGTRVCGVLSRQFAMCVSLEGAYESATFSFAAGTHENTPAVRNDWELQFKNGFIDVSMVTNDRSRVWPLGAVGFDQIEALQPALVDPVEVVLAREGDTYLIHSLDRNTNRFDLIQVLRTGGGAWLVFRWLPIEDPALVRRLVSDTDVRLGDEVHIQMRAGAGGGNANRVYLDGSSNGRLDEVDAVPLDLSGPIDMEEEVRAFVSGVGHIPLGHVWEVLGISYVASTTGDSNGYGEFVIVIGGEKVVEFEEQEAPIAGEWTGQLRLEYGEESRSYVEIANSSQCDVRIRGRLVPSSTGGK